MLEDDEEVKEQKGLKNLTSNKPLIELPVLLKHVKDGNSSYKVRNEIKEISYLLYQHNKITKNVYDKLIKLL